MSSEEFKAPESELDNIDQTAAANNNNDKTPSSTLMSSSTSPATDVTKRTSTRTRRSAASTLNDINSAKTPSRKRKSSGILHTGSAKRGRKQSKESVTPVINMDDPDDPYNFSVNSNVHPEPLKNISIERSPFGELKFTKSLPSTPDRYANVERIAVGRNPQLSASISTPLSNGRNQPKSLSALSDSLRLELSSPRLTTPNTSSRSRLKKKSGASQKEDNDDMEYQFQMEDDEIEEKKRKSNSQKRKSRISILKEASPRTPKKESNTNENFKTPQSGRKRAQPTVADKSASKLTDDELYKVPELSSLEQYAVDHPQDLSHFLQPGTRVLALWGHEHYAANICGRETLGRYYVHFVEDNLNRVLPPTGVIPISFLKPGTRISFIDVIDGEEVGKVSEVVKQPVVQDLDNPTEWIQGYFELLELDEDLNPAIETKQIAWSKIYLTKEQAAHIFQGKTFNPVQLIDRENIVNESRSARRSRSMRNSILTPERSTLEEKKENAKDMTAEDLNLEKSPEKLVLENKPEDVKETREENVDLNVSIGTTTTDQSTPNEVKSVNDIPSTSSTASYDRFNNMALPTPESETKKLSTIQESPEYGRTLSESSLPITLSEPSSEVKVKDKNIFAHLKFVLTSANRPNKATDFNKRECRARIEERAGIVIDDFTGLQLEDTAYLIADTYYRTHKYLCALSLAIPCINHKWIQECVHQNVLLDYKLYLLPAGESSLNSEQVFPWKPLKGELLKNKRMIVYTKFVSDDPKIIPFNEIWAPLVRNLGAILIGDKDIDNEPFSKSACRLATMEQKLDFIKNSQLDILLTESDCEPELAKQARENGALTVSSEWIIQAIVTGALPQITESERFSYDFTN